MPEGPDTVDLPSAYRRDGCGPRGMVSNGNPWITAAQARSRGRNSLGYRVVISTREVADVWRIAEIASKFDYP